MHKLLMVLLVLLIVSGTSFALDVGGYSAITGYGNAEGSQLEVDQEVDLDINALHFDLDGGFDYTMDKKLWAWDYTLGALYTLSVFTFGGTVAGDNELKLGTVTATTDVDLGKLDINAYLELSNDPAVNVFRGTDISGAITFGEGVTMRVGFTFIDEIAFIDDVGYVNAPAVMEGFGVYGKVEASY